MGCRSLHDSLRCFSGLMGPILASLEGLATAGSQVRCHSQSLLGTLPNDVRTKRGWVTVPFPTPAIKEHVPGTAEHEARYGPTAGQRRAEGIKVGGRAGGPETIADSATECKTAWLQAMPAVH